MEVSDVVWQAAIAAVVTIALGWLQYRTKVAAEKAVEKVDEVKETLRSTESDHDVKFDALAKVTDKTHTLVNSRMGAQLRIAASALRRLAGQPGATPEDVAIAEEAEKLSREHEAMQAKVDDKQARQEGRA
jgi:hypothetical protein